MTAIIIGALTSAFVALMGIYVSRRKTKAETADILTQAAERVTRLLTDQLTAASKEVKELRDQLNRMGTDVESLTKQVYLLRQALISLGGDPDTVMAGRFQGIQGIQGVQGVPGVRGVQGVPGQDSLRD